ICRLLRALALSSFSTRRASDLEVVRRLEIYEHRFSANDPTSELSEINKNAGIRPVKVHPELFQLIQIGKEHSLAPNSNMNIAIRSEEHTSNSSHVSISYAFFCL